MLPTNLLALLTSLLASYPISRVEQLLHIQKSFKFGTLQHHIVDTGYAKYLGNQSTQFPETVVYYGVPYAEPPLGERRFRAPVELNETRVRGDSDSDSVVDARNPPEFCVQGGRDNLAGGAGSEDCLKVNVYTPIGTKRGDNLPVLVFFHGGGYIFGNPLNFPFDHWIQTKPSGHKIIIVSVYYRISSFGFLAHPSFLESNNEADLNAGFLDQVQALKWIQRNIDSFGGDSRRVTIDGHSAGASSIELHLVGAASGAGKDVYGSEGVGLFAQAVVQSTYRVPVPLPKQQEPLFEFFAEHAGCGVGNVSVKMACLRKADVGSLARAQDLAMTDAFNNPYRFFRPVVDRALITDYPSKLIMDGKLVNVPLLIGATSNETSIPEGDIEESLRVLFPALNGTDIEEFQAVYPASDFDSSYQHFQVTTGESVFICSVPIIANAFAQATNDADVWAYRYDEPNRSMGSAVVAHSAESWMMFRGTNTRNNGTSNWTTLSSSDVAFSEELISYWLSFVRAGNPNVYKLPQAPEWGRYSMGIKQRMVLRKSQGYSHIRTDDARKGGVEHGEWVGEGEKGIRGSYMELIPEKESERCRFVAGKVEKEQN